MANKLRVIYHSVMSWIYRREYQKLNVLKDPDFRDITRRNYALRKAVYHSNMSIKFTYS